MSDERYDLVFKGQLAKSVELNTAVRNLAQLFKIDPEKARGLFSGKTTVLRKNLDADTANKYRVAIKKAGAIAELQAIVAEKPVQKPASTTPPKMQGRAVFGARDIEPSTPVAATRGERPPQVGVSAKDAIEDESGLTTSPGVFAAPRPQAALAPVPDFGIAPAGEDLLKVSEKRQVPEVNIDTSELSIKENEGNLLHEDEYEEFVPLPIDADAFDIAPVGADVLKPEERKEEVVTEVDTSGLSVGELGQNLAPPKPTAPPPPDTSGLSLAD